VRSRALKWILLSLGALVGLLVLGVLVIVWLVDPNNFKTRIESAVRDATGRELTLVGDIELGFFPWLSLKTGEGRFGNAPGFGAEPMVSWKRARVGARLFPLLSGELVADRIVVEGAEVHLVRRADGTANWQGIGSQDAARPGDPGATPMQLRIAGVRLADSRVVFVDETVPRRLEVTGLAFETDGIEFGKPFTDTEVAGVLHTDGFAPEGVPFKVVIPTATLPADFSAVDVPRVDVALGPFEAEAGVQGTLGDQPRLAGRIDSNEFDLRALLTSMGIEGPKTTDANALRKLRIKAEGRFDAGAISVEPLALTLDDTHLTGHFRRGGGENPEGDFALRGNTLDIARYLPPPDPASEPFVLPTAALKALRFRGVIELDQATMDDIEMKGVTLRLLLDEQGLRPAPAGKSP
jgi:AsmA protein